MMSTSMKTALLILGFACVPPLASGHASDVLNAVENLDADTPDEIHFEFTGDLPKGGHLQGVQWFQRGGRDYLLLSGSADAFSYLLTVDLSGSPASAAITKLLNAPYRHAGGLQIFDGRFAAVGIEDNHARNTSKVWVIDTTTLTPGNRPVPLVEIERRGEIKVSTAGAIAIAKIEAGHRLIVGTWDSATLDMYQSNGHPLGDRRCTFPDARDVGLSGC